MSTLTTTRLGRAAALMAVTGSLAAMPAAASAAEQPAARAGAQPVTLSAASMLSPAPPVAVRSTTRSRRVRTKWGFNVQIWSYTVADPAGVYRLYYYRKCNPSYPTRWLTMKSGWVYRTYACWVKLA